MDAWDGGYFEECEFIENHATAGPAGALFCNNGAVLTGCSFVGNTASSSGGAVRCQAGTATFAGCAFSGNAADTDGGLWSTYLARTTLVGCLFSGNTATGPGGGGVHQESGRFKVLNCTFLGNVAAGGSGGAVYTLPNDLSEPWEPPGTELVNCLVSGNGSVGPGAGVFVACTKAPAIVANCTIVGNSGASEGGGVYIQDVAPPEPPRGRIVNSIVRNNGSGEVGGEPQPLLVSYSDVAGGYAGPGNIDADPMFVDPSGGDYHLQPGSPCIDAGHNWGVPLDAADIDGDADALELVPLDRDGSPRFNADPADLDPGCGVPVVVDMGAHELQFGPVEEIRLGDINGDGTVGITDLLVLLAGWGPALKDCALDDLNLDRQVGIEDLLILLAGWG
jgi:predicted outer membrane repeat protein